MDSRSGGEKAIAGLALLFSLAIELKPEPPHFILLDEVDAPLDTDNSNLLANFIKEWMAKKLDFKSDIQKVP